MRLYDNTRLAAYKRCPRYYYYRHVRHWELSAPKPALIFGGAWHAAQDVMWTLLCNTAESDESIVTAAYAAFLKHWVEGGMPHPSEIDYELEKQLSPRTPGNALEMIVGYVHKRKAALRGGDFELIECEQPFAVPLNAADLDLIYIGKMDKVVRRGKQVGVIEHKTTTAYSKSSSFRSSFLESFSPNSQVDGYLYALHITFPNNVFGVWVDAALVHKTEQAFEFIPIERQMRQLDLWMWEARDWIAKIEHDTEALAEATPNHPYLAAFPKNTNSCFDFNTACPYITMCKSWPNPVDRDIPNGFAENRWDPLTEVDPENKLELAK